MSILHQFEVPFSNINCLFGELLDVPFEITTPLVDDFFEILILEA